MAGKSKFGEPSKVVQVTIPLSTVERMERARVVDRAPSTSGFILRAVNAYLDTVEGDEVVTLRVDGDRRTAPRREIELERRSVAAEARVAEVEVEKANVEQELAEAVDTIRGLIAEMESLRSNQELAVLTAQIVARYGELGMLAACGRTVSDCAATHAEDERSDGGGVPLGSALGGGDAVLVEAAGDG